MMSNLLLKLLCSWSLLDEQTVARLINPFDRFDDLSFLGFRLVPLQYCPIPTCRLSFHNNGMIRADEWSETSEIDEGL